VKCTCRRTATFCQAHILVNAPRRDFAILRPPPKSCQTNTSSVHTQPIHTMISAQAARTSSHFGAKRRLDPRKAQFAKQPEWQAQEYSHRLNFYVLPPTAEISLEQFEEWAISRLKGSVTQESTSSMYIC
jgi:hypothetical protein